MWIISKFQYLEKYVKVLLHKNIIIMNIFLICDGLIYIIFSYRLYFFKPTFHFQTFSIFPCNYMIFIIQTFSIFSYIFQ